MVVWLHSRCCGHAQIWSKYPSTWNSVTIQHWGISNMQWGRRWEDRSNKGLLQEANQRRVKTGIKPKTPGSTTELRPPGNHQALIIRCLYGFGFHRLPASRPLSPNIKHVFTSSWVLTTEPLRYGVRDVGGNATLVQIVWNDKPWTQLKNYTPYRSHTHTYNTTLASYVCVHSWGIQIKLPVTRD